MRKLAVVAFSFAAAIFAANYGLPDIVLFPMGCLLCLLCPLVWVLGKKKHRRRALKGALCCAGLGAGFLWMILYTAVFFLPAQKWMIRRFA